MQEISRSVWAPRINRRVAAGVALIAVVAVLTVAGLRWDQKARPLDATSAPVSVGSTAHPAIAVMSFDVAGAPDADIGWLSSGVPSMLVTGLAQTRGLDLVSTRRLIDAGRQIGVANLESLDRSQAADVARRAGASALVVGTIFKSGAEIRIDAQMEDLASGRVLVAEGVRGADVFTLVDQLASRFRTAVGLANAPGVRGIAAVSSPSLDAYRLYTQGAQAFQNVRKDDAARLFEQAVRIDPDFAAAHLYLGLSHYFTGNDVARRRHFAKASEHAERLNERQRLLLQAEMARDAGNGAEAERLLDQLLAEFPDWHDGYASAFELYASIPGLVYKPEERLTLLRRSVEAQPTASLPRNVLGYALLETSRFKQALDQFETYARLSPHEPNPYDSLGEVYLAMGFPEKGLEYYSRSLAIDPGFAPPHIGRSIGLAMLGRFDAALAEEPANLALKAFLLMRVGRYREAAGVIEMSIGRSIEKASVVGQSTGAFMSSLLALNERQYVRALREIDQARRILAPLPRARQRVYLVLADLMAGLAYVRAGQLDRARVRLDSQKRLYREANPFEKGWHAALVGEIALAEKRPADAAAAFSSGEPATRVWTSVYLDYPWALVNDIPARDGMARVATARGDVAGAIQIFRRLLVVGPDQKWPALFDPRYVLELARLLEQSGDRKAALVEYQRFLELWNNADNNLPELAEARRAVARLRAN